VAKKKRPDGPRGESRRESASRAAPAEPPRARRGTRARWSVAASVAALLLIAAAIVYWRTCCAPNDDRPAADRLPFPAPAATPVRRVAAADFVGAERCASCHRQQYDAWRTSTHGRAGGPPSTANLIAPFGGTPIRFRDAVVIPQAAGGAYRFVVRQDGLPERVFTVDAVVGGGHMQGGGTQGLVSRFPDGTYRFLPFDYSRHSRTWFCNTESRLGRGWVPITPALSLADCGDWPPARVLGDEPRFTNCQSCHGSQIDVRFDTAARSWATTFSSLAVNCESCHGPGRRHIELVSSGTPPGADIGMTALATLSKDRAIETCFQCHALKDRIEPGYTAGASLAEYYSLRTPQLGDAPHFPDGRVRTFAYQEGHLYSDCYLSGALTCTSCHDPHTQGYRDVNGAPLPGRFDDRQCTSCHVSKAENIPAHTKHSATSAGSRCVSCHMPYLQEPETGDGIRYARSDHSIPIPRPAFDSTLRITSACRQCHTDRSESALDAQVRTWYGEIKPHAPAVDRLVRSAAETDPTTVARLVLEPETSHVAALFAGLAAFIERYVTPDMPSLAGETIERLERLAGHGDPDVRAAALAALHVARGDDRTVRRFLAGQLGGLGAQDHLVRSRWALVIGFLGDRARTSGDARSAIALYRKVLELDPRNAHALLNLGLAYADAGDAVAAIESYRRSLDADAAQPLAFVNLGIALEQQGDLAQAADAYRRAIAINPREALAYFNLGNGYLRARDARSAIPFYEQATTYDPGLTLAHVYLARCYAATGDLAKARVAVRRALAVEPGNREAQELRGQLGG
jgi:tetratricopeptide (TPR) repeat protein